MEQYEKIYLYKRVVSAKLFIDKFYADSIDLDDIAEQANFSKFHFIRLFKSIYGLTPKNYLIHLRIEKAKELLRAGHSILATGLMVGLESPTSFAGMFKKITGQTPSHFQKSETIRKNKMNEHPLQFIPNCFAESHGWKK